MQQDQIPRGIRFDRNVPRIDASPETQTADDAWNALGLIDGEQTIARIEQIGVGPASAQDIV
ncbi:hypothetical protein, partial [Achromobacter xylosoxidans]|uniref:hypothetical protein n=1 Tax=Alcaligenes xylosoxydans xylosoxydans TaxID=85698 RepID=UPI001F12D635